MLKVFFLSLTLTFVSSIGFAELGAAPQEEIIFVRESRNLQPTIPESQWPNLRSGCRSINACGSNNTNRFTGTATPGVTCTKRDFLRKCGSGQKLVCSESYGIKTCVDTNLTPMENDSSTPQGNFSYNQCKAHCESKGMRLLTNNEWLVAAVGTDASNCRPKRIGSRPDWDKPHSTNGGMLDLSFNQKEIPKDRECTSAFGIKDMAGVLGQYVEEGHFNGGLWPQPTSTIFYKTGRHMSNRDYRDYSIGCRCAKNVN